MGRLVEWVSGGGCSLTTHICKRFLSTLVARLFLWILINRGRWIDLVWLLERAGRHCDGFSFSRSEADPLLSVLGAAISFQWMQVVFVFGWIMKVFFCWQYEERLHVVKKSSEGKSLHLAQTHIYVHRWPTLTLNHILAPLYTRGVHGFAFRCVVYFSF